MYKAYIFDLYGTLVDIKTDEKQIIIWEKMALYFGYFGVIYEPEELQDKYLKTIEKLMEANKKTKYPDIEIEDVFYKLFRLKNVQPKKKAARDAAKVFRMLSTEYIKVYDGVFELLKLLRGKGKQVYLLSNAQTKFTIPELKHLGLKDYFDGIYISSDYGMCKPCEDFFGILLKTEELKKQECIMIGNDYSTDIKGANGIGMDSIYIQTNIVNEEAKEQPSKYKILSGNIMEVAALTGLV